MSEKGYHRLVSYHKRIQRPAERGQLRDLLSAHGQSSDRDDAVDHGIAWIWRRCTEQPAQAAREYAVYTLYRAAVQSAAIRVLAAWSRFSAYLEHSASPSQHAWLCRSITRLVSMDDRDDAVQEARYRLWRQVRDKPFHCDERYGGYQQFRRGLRTTALRRLDTRHELPVLLTDLDIVDRRPVTGITPSTVASQSALLGGEQSRRWVIAACAGWSPEDIASMESIRLREQVTAWEVFRRVDMLRRAHHLHAVIPSAFSRRAKRYVRAWLRHSGYALDHVDLQLVLGCLTDHRLERLAARLGLDPQWVEERCEILYWRHAWYRYWLDPARAQLDRRLAECRAEVTQRYPKLNRERHIDTLAASWAGEPQIATARRQYHANLRHKPTASSVSSEVHWLTKRYCLHDPLEPEAPRSA